MGKSSINIFIKDYKFGNAELLLKYLLSDVYIGRISLYTHKLIYYSWNLLYLNSLTSTFS